MAKWLLVDDEVDIRTVVKVMFLVWGHKAIEFSNGHDAFDFIEKVESGDYEEERPVLALMDIRMPGPNGNEIARRLRESSVFGKIPIVLMTAFGLTEALQNDYRNCDGVDKIIFKPLPAFDEVYMLLLEVIEQRQKRNETEDAIRKEREERRQQRKKEKDGNEQ